MIVRLVDLNDSYQVEIQKVGGLDPKYARRAESHHTELKKRVDSRRPSPFDGVPKAV